jgi:aldehyde:ferredoxin oxidoreductase
MSKGYMGKVMWVNLSQKRVDYEDIPDEMYEKFLSGYGLGAKILFDNIPPGADPLGPENILGFCAGLLTGTPSIMTGRWMVVAKSPLTGGWGDANCGGDLSPAIKRAGVDAIFFTGISEGPVYLMVDGDKVEIRDASGIWGKDTVETEDAIRKDLGDEKGQFRIACIGPAAERLSLISGISNDKGRFAARSGLGSVMGSKKLKAIAVKGKSKIEAQDSERIKDLSKAFSRSLNRADFVMKILNGRLLKGAGWLFRVAPPQAMMGDTYRLVLKKYGTAGITSLSSENGDSPVKNFSGAGFRDFPLGRAGKISDDAVIKYEEKKYGCYSCPIRCGGIIKVKEGPYPLEESHKPEYETLCVFGAYCLCDDVYTILKINDLCNRGGLDTISAGVAVGFAIECFEQGILTKEDTGGLELRWGAGETILKLVEKMIKREGIGDLLADGVKRAAEKIGKGSEKYAMHAGGQELPMHDPRFDPGYGTAYISEPTPGRHTISGLTWQEMMRMDRYFSGAKKIPLSYSKQGRLSPKGKVTNQVLNSKFMQIINSVGMCMFGVNIGPRAPLFEWLNAATGWTKSPDEYLEVGERIETLRHSFNVREGIKPKDFKINPRAVGDPPLEYGPHAKVTVDLEAMKRNFYDAFDWDYETGKPSRDRLEKLGLHEVIKEFYG